MTFVLNQIKFVSPCFTSTIYEHFTVYVLLLFVLIRLVKYLPFVGYASIMRVIIQIDRANGDTNSAFCRQAVIGFQFRSEYLVKRNRLVSRELDYSYYKLVVP